MVSLFMNLMEIVKDFEDREKYFRNLNVRELREQIKQMFKLV